MKIMIIIVVQKLKIDKCNGDGNDACKRTNKHDSIKEYLNHEVGKNYNYRRQKRN